MISGGWLIVGSCLGVAGDVAGKLSAGHTVISYAIAAYCCFFACIFCWITAINQLPIIAAFVVWTGIAVAGNIIAGLMLFNETISLTKLVLIAIVLTASLGLVMLEGKSGV